MAATNYRFSIRDYAANRRIVDLTKSWPFAAAGGEDEKPPLPPISTCRFRWWADELSSARSAAEEARKDELIEHRLPKFPSNTTTKRARMPKKRSIAELFASAPQIERSAAAGDGVEEELMRKRKKGPIKMEIRALKKEKICKPKMISSSRSHLLQDPINTITLQKTAEVVVGSKKKFLKLKTLQKKHYILQKPNIMSRNQKLVKKLPVRGILKNKNRVSSARKTRKIDNAKTVELIKRCSKTTRHVTFSEKDDILGHSKKCSSIDLPQFKSLCKIFSDVLTKSSVMNNSSKVHGIPAANADVQVVNASVEETNAGVVDRTDESSSQKNQSNESLGNVNHRKLVDSSNSSCSSTEKATMAVMIDLNHAMETSNDLDCFNPSTENMMPNCTNSDDLDFKCTTQRKESSNCTEFYPQREQQKISLPSITPTERTFVSASNATNFLSAMNNPGSHSSTSCLIGCNEINEKQCRQYFHVDMNCYHHNPENQWEQHCSPKDLLSNNICYSMESNKFRGSVFLSNSASTSQSKSTGEDFIGFPLNKQGEPCQMHQGIKFVEPYKKQNLDLAYSHGFYAGKQVLDSASCQSDQLDWCQKQYHPTRERRFTEFICPERLNIQNNEPVKGKYEFLDSHANKTKLSFHDEESGDATLDLFKRVDLREQCNLACQLEPIVQPTIRLMGQNVVVGGSTNRDSHSSIMHQEYLSKQRMMPEFVANTACKRLSNPPSIFYHTEGHVEPQFESHIEDHGSESLSRKNISSTTRNNIFKVDVNSQAKLHRAFLNKTDKLIGNSISGEESMRHQYYPTTASYQQNIQQNMLLSSTHWNHTQGVSCGTFITPQSLPCNVHENLFQPLHTQPTEKLPQWSLQANHQERNQLPSSLYFCQTDLSQPCRFYGTNLIPHRPPYNMPMVPFSCDNISHAKASTFTSNSSQSSFISVISAANSTSEVTKSNAIKNKEREGPYSNFTGFNSQVDTHEIPKRQAGRDYELVYSAKKPYFKKQANYFHTVEQQETNLTRDRLLLDYANASNVQKAVNEVDELSNAESFQD